MQINSKLHRIFGVKSLAQKRCQYSSENIAHPAARHPGITGGIDKRLPFCCRDYGSCPLEHDVTAALHRKRASGPDAVAIYGGSVLVDQPGHLSWLRCENRWWIGVVHCMWFQGCRVRAVGIVCLK